MTPPTLKQIIEKATPGPWRETKAVHGVLNQYEQAVPLIAAIQGERGPDVCRFIAGPEQDANAQLIARCSPAVMLAVVEAMDMTEALLKAISAHHDTLPRDLVIACKIRTQMVTEALNLLNGKAP